MSESKSRASERDLQQSLQSLQSKKSTGATTKFGIRCSNDRK